MCAGQSGSQIMYICCRQTGCICKSILEVSRCVYCPVFFYVLDTVNYKSWNIGLQQWISLVLLVVHMGQNAVWLPDIRLRAWRECMWGMGPCCAEGHLSFAQRILYLLSTDVCSHISPPARGWWWWVGITGTVHWNVKHTQPLRGWQAAPLLNRDCVVQQPRLSSSPTARCQNNQ